MNTTASRRSGTTPKSSKTSKKRNAESASPEVSRELRDKLDELAGILTELNAVDIGARWRIGKEVVDLQRDEKKYGKHAVDVAASHLGVGRDMLYDAAKVYRTWPKKIEIDKLISMRSVEGERSLQFSHLTVIASCPDRSEQERLLDVWQETGCSVRDLRSAAKGTKDDTGTVEEAGESPSVLSIDELTVVGERGQREMDRFLEVVVPAIKAAGGLPDDRARRRVRDCLGILIQFRQSLDRVIDEAEALAVGELSERSDDLGVR